MKDMEYYKRLIQFYIGDNFEFEHEGGFNDETLFFVTVTIKCSQTKNVVEVYFSKSHIGFEYCYKGISEDIENNFREHLCYDNYVKTLQ